MPSTRSESIMRVRSFLVDNTASKSGDEVSLFVLDVLLLLPGPVDLNQVVPLRRYTHPVHDVPPLPYLFGTWNTRALCEMQIQSRPVANRQFCNLCLALAMDIGVDIPGERLLAIRLSLHPRVGAESKLRVLGNDIVGLIANMSLWE